MAFYLNDPAGRPIIRIHVDVAGGGNTFWDEGAEINHELEESLQKSGLTYITLYFTPKFHCELNHIERFWCHGKKYGWPSAKRALGAWSC